MLLTGEQPRVLPSSDSKSGKDPGDFHFSPQLDEDIDIFGERMSGGTGPASPVVKNEPSEWDDLVMTTPHPQGMSLPNQGRFGHMPSGSINPSELSTQSGGSYDMPHMGGAGQSMAGSFPMGAHTGMANSGITDDELLGLGDLSEAHRAQPHAINTQHNGRQDEFEKLMAMQQHGQHGIPQPMFSHTPAGEPIQSPYAPGFNFQAYQQAQQQAQAQAQMAQHMSPAMRPMTAGNGHIMTQDLNFAGGRPRHSLGQMMERKASDSRSPMTPKTPGQNGFDMAGTPDSGSGGMSLPGHQHPGRLSGGAWDSNPASLHSLHSPMSPATHPGHSPFSEVIKGQKHHNGSPSGPASASVGGHHGVPSYQTQEAKRRRRRESHNLVERRRRDNINERIQELSHLVPHHRLEDEKVRKHLATNGPLSPTLSGLGSASSPAAATSLLAGQGGRRATGAGTITLGLPPDDKDKGPNKGDILNGSVGWTRDLMWALHRALAREQTLRDAYAQRGEPWPFGAAEAEDDRRMRSELRLAVQQGTLAHQVFQYSRGPASGLHVPGHTNVAGEPLRGGAGGGGGAGQAAQGAPGGAVPEGPVSPQDLSPAASSAAAPSAQHQHRDSADSDAAFWAAGDGFKEEGEDYIMN